MIFLGIIMQPLVIFGYYSVPTYWHPSLFFGLPVGIEDLLGGFFLSGIAGVIYEEISNIHLKKIRESLKIEAEHGIVPLLVLILSLGAFFVFKTNIMITLVVGLVLGTILLGTIRPNLRKAILLSGIYFGLLYSIIFSIWLFLFPEALQWWNLDIFWGVTILGVPLGEVLFGFLYGAFWGPIYEFLFGYSEVPFINKRKKKKR